MDKRTTLTLVAFFVLITSVPGPLLLVIYSKIIGSYPELSISLYKARSGLSSIIASYAFTMIGFLAAGIALLLNYASSPAFKKYKKHRYLDVFFVLYFYCIFTLAFTFLLSLLSLSSAPSHWFMRAALAASINSMLQVFVLSFAIISICRRSLNS